jgi:hypothetical protein
MGVQVFKKNIFSNVFAVVRACFFTLLIVAIIFVAVKNAAAANAAEGVRLLEDALRRAAVHSYSVSGYFPESVEYIVENFGVHIDTTRFVVHYDVFASNILPDIRVFELRGAQ